MGLYMEKEHKPGMEFKNLYNRLYLNEKLFIKEMVKRSEIILM